MPVPEDAGAGGRGAGDERGRSQERGDAQRERGRSQTSRPRGPLATTPRRPSGESAGTGGMRQRKRSTTGQGDERNEAGSEPRQRKRSNEELSRDGSVRRTDKGDRPLQPARPAPAPHRTTPRPPPPHRRHPSARPRRRGTRRSPRGRRAWSPPPWPPRGRGRRPPWHAALAAAGWDRCGCSPGCWRSSSTSASGHGGQGAMLSTNTSYLVPLLPGHRHAPQSPCSSSSWPSSCLGR